MRGRVSTEREQTSGLTDGRSEREADQVDSRQVEGSCCTIRKNRVSGRP
jgi:hypothetical protein